MSTPNENAAALHTYIDDDQVKKDVAIDSANLTAEMQNHASLYVHYATQAVRARRQVDRYKAAFEVLEAQLEAQYRETLRSEYEATIASDPKNKAKAPTEAQIRAAVVSDPKWKAMSGRVIEAQHIHKLCEVAERAFEHRRELLLQIARDAARQEAGPLRVMANQNAADARDALLRKMQANAASA